MATERPDLPETIHMLLHSVADSMRTSLTVPNSILRSHDKQNEHPIGMEDQDEAKAFSRMGTVTKLFSMIAQDDSDRHKATTGAAWMMLAGYYWHAEHSLDDALGAVRTHLGKNYGQEDFKDFSPEQCEVIRAQLDSFVPDHVDVHMEELAIGAWRLGGKLFHYEQDGSLLDQMLSIS
jgi:hypothetical protein